jgi:holliday junction DNA helicase RuvB
MPTMISFFIVVFSSIAKYNIERLNKPLKSRFSIFSLPEYDYEEFRLVGLKLLMNQYNLPLDTAVTVIEAVWNKMNSKDVRDLLKLAKVVRRNDAPEDIERIIRVQLKYSVGDNEDSEFN